MLINEIKPIKNKKLIDNVILKQMLTGSCFHSFLRCLLLIIYYYLVIIKRIIWYLIIGSKNLIDFLTIQISFSAINSLYATFYFKNSGRT